MADKINYFIVYYMCIIISSVNSVTKDEEAVIVEKGERKITEYVKVILEHYKQKDPIGLPGNPLPDPMGVENIAFSISIGKMQMTDVKVHGLSKFRLNHVTTNLGNTKADVGVTIDELFLTGNYTLSTWFTKSAGPFTIHLKHIYVTATVRLDVEISGKLEAQEINMDATFRNIDLNFERLGMFANLFQGVVNSVGSAIFDSVKPIIFNNFYATVRTFVNEKVSQTITIPFPNSISPFDQVVAECRKIVRNKGFDPYKISDYNHTAGLMFIQMTNTWITGTSSFHRVGNVTFELRNETIFGDIEIGTQRVQGSSNWDVSVVGGILGKAGTIIFTVEYIKVRSLIQQSLDTRNPPKLHDIQLELGNIQVRFNGAGTLDYLIEFGVNIIPNVLRYQIMDAMETPLKNRIQQMLNKVDVEKAILTASERFDDGTLEEIDILTLVQ